MKKEGEKSKMTKNIMNKTVGTVRERERERVILTKLCFVSHVQKSNKKYKEKRDRLYEYVRKLCVIAYPFIT